MRNVLVPAAIACITLAPPMAVQATLASRVTGAPDGVVRVQFDSRPGSCGDGRTMIGYRTVLFARDYSNVGKWRDQRCVPGPVRVALTVAGGVVTHESTQVGGNWPGADGRVTDLGVVPAPEASTYFFALVPRLESASTRDRLLLPAVLADGGGVMSPLVTLARDGARNESTRRQALQWIGLLGDSSAVPVLVGFATGGPADDERGTGLAGSAVAALGTIEGYAGIPALVQLARSAPMATRRNAVFWLGQNDDPRGLRVLHTIVNDANEDERLREHAVFSLSQRDDTESFDALMRIARGDANTRLPSKALFWLAQKHDPRVTALIGELVLK